MISSFLKFLFVLIVLGLIALTGYAYLGDLSPHLETVTKPVVLNGE